MKLLSILLTRQHSQIYEATPMKKYFVLILLFAFVFPLFAQQEKEHEVNSEIKELTEFHDVIYQIWHTAWPEKDIKLLKSFVAQVEDGYEKIKKAELPGILRDKKSKWEDGVKKLGEFVELYKSTASKTDSVGLLNAAEKLHAQYEVLVRIIKPLSKEIDNFHQELYMIYHYYVPNYDYDKIKKSVTMLRARNESIFVSKIPERLKAKKEAFEKAKIELDNAVQELFELVLNVNDKDKITKAVDVVHSKYQELEKVFD